MSMKRAHIKAITPMPERRNKAENTGILINKPVQNRIEEKHEIPQTTLESQRKHKTLNIKTASPVQAPRKNVTCTAVREESSPCELLVIVDSEPSGNYNVPENVQNEGTIDGIVPLQAAKNAPKHKNLLKNEIISENAKVLFVPTIPMPSPIIVQHKLCPTPRLVPDSSSIQDIYCDPVDESLRAHLDGADVPSLLRQLRGSNSSFSTLSTVIISSDEDEVEAKEDSFENKKKKQMELKKLKRTAVDKALMPQIKRRLNNGIVVDNSCFLDADLDVLSLVMPWGGSRTPRRARWSSSETELFYHALACLGTDFTNMTALFPDRTRREIKMKYKKEERINGARVYEAVRMVNPLEACQLKAKFQVGREVTAKMVAAIKLAKKQEVKLKLDILIAQERERLRLSRQLRVRNSLASKALESTMLPGVANGQTIRSRAKTGDNLATVSGVIPPSASPLKFNIIPKEPSDIKKGSLLVRVTMNREMKYKKIQTYKAGNANKLMPFELPPTMLKSVMAYIRRLN